MKQPELKSHEIQLTSKHRLHFDKMNLTLTRIYQKREGKGKNAPFIDEFDYNSPSFYGNLTVLLDRLVDKEFMEGMSDEEIADIHEYKEIVEHAKEYIDQVKKEIKEHVNEYITVALDEEKKVSVKKVKGVKITE